MSRRPIRGMPVLIFWTALRGSQNSSFALSQVMIRVITGDESLILEYDPETKPQSREWHTANSPRPKKARSSKSKIKSMFISFLTDRGSSTRNLCHQDKLSIKLFIGKSLKDSGKGGTCATRHCTHLDAAPQQCPMSHGSLYQ